VPIVYFPMIRTNSAGVAIAERTLTHVVRATGGTDVIPQIRQAIWAINPNLPLAGLGTHAEVVRRSLGQTAFAMTMLAMSAVMALLLGTLGIYSVISYIVSQRSREIGVRMALGADRETVGRLIMRQGAGLAGVGVAIGFVAALGFARLLAATLFGVSPLDPLTYGTVAVGLATVALIATYVPARRATRVDPVVALRGH